MNNDKLMLALLTNIFGDKATSVLAICNATQQPVVALEMAAGLYEMPALGYVERKVKNHYEDFTAQRTGFNALVNEQVSYAGERTKTYYFANEADAAKFAECGSTYGKTCNKEQLEDLPHTGVYTEKVNGCCTLDTWLAYEEAR